MSGDRDINYSLIRAVREGNLERVRELIGSFGLSYSQAWLEGYVLLRDAIVNKHTEVAKLLLMNGSRVNSKNQKPSDTPLHYAAINGDIEIVEMLLDRGANTNAKNRYGITALHNAVKSKNMEIIELLVNQGAYVNATNRDSVTPLLLAVEKGSEEIIKLLLQHGADVNSVCTATSWEGYTPLCLAVKGGHEKVVKLLLEGGANVNAQDKCGKSVLHFAVEKGHEKFVQLLLECGANVDAQDKDGEKFVQLLLECGANVDAQDKDGKTALHLAVEKEQEKLVKLLLECGANVDAQNKDGKTAIHIAVVKGLQKVVELLLECGANVDAEDKGGKTVLHFVVDNYERDYYDSHYDNYYHGFSVFESIAEILKRHVAKMKAANLYVSKTNLLPTSCHCNRLCSPGWDSAFSLSISNDEISDFQKECAEEIASMKSEKVGNSDVSFYDILTKGISQLAMYAGNESIVQILRSGIYKIKFPIYASMLNCNFRKGERRKELLEQGNKIFHFLFDSLAPLPHVCTDKIFSYLSDGDLRIVIDVCKPIIVNSTNTDINNVAIISNIPKI